MTDNDPDARRSQQPGTSPSAQESRGYGDVGSYPRQNARPAGQTSSNPYRSGYDGRSSSRSSRYGGADGSTARSYGHDGVVRRDTDDGAVTLNGRTPAEMARQRGSSHVEQQLPPGFTVREGSSGRKVVVREPVQPGARRDQMRRDGAYGDAGRGGYGEGSGRDRGDRGAQRTDRNGRGGRRSRRSGISPALVIVAAIVVVVIIVAVVVL